MKKLEENAKKLVKRIIDIEMYGWPPVCFGTIYQPARPSDLEKRKKNLRREES